MSEPLVSIVTPCHNAGAYIETAIESALSQDCRVQVIIVDDGSTDDSAARAQRYEPDIQLLRTTNRGVAHARNSALHLLKAPYTLLLDADDRMAPQALQHLLSAINGKQDCLVHGFFQPWNADMTKPLSPASLKRMRSNAFHELSRQNFSPPGAVLFPTNVIERVGDFDQVVAGCEDWDFWVRMARSGLRFIEIKQIVFHYRRMPHTASNQAMAMLVAGLEVIRRAHSSDQRVRGDQFPTGLADKTMPEKVFLYGADCFALSVMQGKMEEMEQVFKRIPIPVDPDWRAFCRTLRLSLWRHSQIDHIRETTDMRAGLLNAARFLAPYVPRFCLEAILYPNFSPFLFRPGPKKAFRLLKEWREAKAVVDSLTRQD